MVQTRRRDYLRKDFKSMCTVTLHRGRKGLRLTMNRDEALSRAIELAPFTSQSEGIEWIGPRDSERAGAWIGVNRFGIAGCLLNGNVSLEQAIADSQREGPSRGEIIPRLMAATSLDEARHRFLEGIDPSVYPAFMLVLATNEEAYLFRAWSAPNPEETVLAPGWAMITSSQWNRDEVLQQRRKYFESWVASGCPTVGGIPTFNVSRIPDQESWSPLMERPHSTTRSVTHVSTPLEPGPITMVYGCVRELRIDFEEYTLENPSVYSGSQ